MLLTVLFSKHQCANQYLRSNQQFDIKASGHTVYAEFFLCHTRRTERGIYICHFIFARLIRCVLIHSDQKLFNLLCVINVHLNGFIQHHLHLLTILPWKVLASAARNNWNLRLAADMKYSIASLYSSNAGANSFFLSCCFALSARSSARCSSWPTLLHH